MRAGFCGEIAGDCAWDRLAAPISSQPFSDQIVAAALAQRDRGWRSPKAWRANRSASALRRMIANSSGSAARGPRPSSMASKEADRLMTHGKLGVPSYAPAARDHHVLFTKKIRQDAVAGGDQTATSTTQTNNIRKEKKSERAVN